MLAATIPVLNESNLPSEEPYRFCEDIKNLHDKNGTYIKTICSVYDYRSFANAQTFCGTNQMRLAKADTPAAQAAIIAYGRETFYWYFAGYIWIDGPVTLANRCSLLTNLGAPKGVEYSIQNYPCTSAFYHICEFKF